MNKIRAIHKFKTIFSLHFTRNSFNFFVWLLWLGGFNHFYRIIVTNKILMIIGCMYILHEHAHSKKFLLSKNCPTSYAESKVFEHVI